MKIDDAQITEITTWALRYAKGDPWRAYEYAKREVGALLDDAPPQAFDSAARRIAAALHI